MAGNTTHPRVWLNGDVFAAVVGSTAPTDVASAWAAAWKPLGLLSEDGMTGSMESDSTDLYAWGGILVRTVRSKHKQTFKVIALEDNPTVFALVHPGSTQVTATGVTTRTVKNPTANPMAFGVETKDLGYIRRLIIPRGEVTSVSEIAAVETELTKFELEITAYAASDGTVYVEITNDPAAVVV